LRDKALVLAPLVGIGCSCCYSYICRSLGGIPALVELLHNSKPEVYRNALGCLLNLSRGYENDDNKRAIKQCGGLEALVKLLDRTHDNDARELISGILWNMSSLGVSNTPQFYEEMVLVLILCLSNDEEGIAGDLNG